jgi:DNA-binding beta-propeller fold protein YncE
MLHHHLGHRAGLALAGSVLALACAGLAQAAKTEAPAKLFYRLAASVPLKGKAPSWDHLTYDPDSGRLYVARRAGGVTVIDTRTRKIIGSIKGAEGANAVALAPEFDRGYTANGDGVATVFKLSTLQTLARIKMGESADGAFYDATHKLVVVTRGDDHRLTFIDARTGKISGEVATESKELESIAVDAKGWVYVAERDKTAVAKVDAVNKAVVQEWKVGADCSLPTGIAIDSQHDRLFIGCKGDKPVLAVVDTQSGQTVASAAIGRGNDGLVFDPARKTLIASNGVEGNLVVFDQVDPDHYRLNQAVTTQPLARTLAYDPKTADVFTMTAEGVVDPSRPINRRAGTFYPNVYYDDSFRVLVYRLMAYKAPAPSDD